MFRKKYSHEDDMPLKKVKRKKKKNMILILLYFIFGIYFLNFKLPLLVVPEFVLGIENLLIFFGGALLLYAGFKRLRR